MNNNNSGSQVNTTATIKSQTFEAIIKTKEGKVINLGTISYAHNNPILNFIGRNLVRLKTELLVWFYLKRGKRE